MSSDRSEERRQRVLEAAIAAIAETGVERIRLADIAERAGMSAGHILYYFGSKDAILTQTLSWSEHDLAEHRAERLAEQSPGEPRVRCFVDLYLPVGLRDARWNLWAQLLSRPPVDSGRLDDLDVLSDLWRRDLEAILGVLVDDPARLDAAARLGCYLLDGIALDLLVGAASLSREAAVALATDGILALCGPGAAQPSR
jgi:AcrR family transcriptional regulator